MWNSGWFTDKSGIQKRDPDLRKGDGFRTDSNQALMHYKESQKEFLAIIASITPSQFPRRTPARL